MDISVLKAVPLFKDIDAEDLEALSQLMSETSLKRGDSLFREGDEGDRLYIVTDGKVKLSHSSDDGRENLIAVRPRRPFLYGHRDRTHPPDLLGP